MRKVIKYEAPWCMSCGALQVQLDKLVEAGTIELERVDVSVNPQAARDAGVRGLPTLMEDGKMVTLKDLTDA